GLLEHCGGHDPPPVRVRIPGHSHICAESGRILLHFLEDKSAREVGAGPGRLSSVTESMPTVVPVSARNPGYDTPGPRIRFLREHAALRDTRRTDEWRWLPTPSFIRTGRG